MDKAHAAATSYCILGLVCRENRMEVKDIQKAKPPQGGGLNGGAQEPRSANFSISCFVDPVLPPPCPFEQEKNAFVRTGEVRLGLGQKNDPDPALGANPTNPAACFCRQMKGETDP